MARKKRKNLQNIQTELHAKSTAQLDSSLEGFKDIPDPPVFDVNTWGAGANSPPHIINGVPQTDEEEKVQEQNGNPE